MSSIRCYYFTPNRGAYRCRWCWWPCSCDCSWSSSSLLVFFFLFYCFCFYISLLPTVSITTTEERQHQDSAEQKIMLRREALSFHLSSINSKYSTFFYSLMQLIPPSLATQRKASGESVSNLSQCGVVDKSFSDRANSHCWWVLKQTVWSPCLW